MSQTTGGYLYEASTTVKKNFLDSEVGLVLKTCEVNNTGLTADEDGYKTVTAGTIFPADDATAKGIIFEDVDVTRGSKTAPLMVAGRALEDRLTISSAAKTALSNIVFVDAPTTSRGIITAKSYTAGTTAFGGSDIAEADDGGTLTITAIGDDNDTDICTVALNSSTHKVTATNVAAGTTHLTCTVSDDNGNTLDVVVTITMS